MRGDVPNIFPMIFVSSTFSPRARGCSEDYDVEAIAEEVFPACAGMFRCCISAWIWASGFPRVRGDVPGATCPLFGGMRFSPRARGCSPVNHKPPRCDKVFPACAGMFRRFRSFGFPFQSFPRVRGDVPPPCLPSQKRGAFSPRARGCSVA